MSIILAFLQERLDPGSFPSMLKVYVVAIAAFNSTLEGYLVGKYPLVMGFLRGGRHLNLPSPCFMPVWDLSLLLSALPNPPFKPAEMSKLGVLSFKTELLLTLACG